MATLLLNIDKTILHSYSLFYPLASLKPEEAFEMSPTRPVFTADPIEWKDYVSRLHRAYKIFVTLVSNEEAEEEPLGIFRPGFIEAMERIENLYHRGIVKRVILYSSYPFKLLSVFARHVIRHSLFFRVPSSPSSPSSPSLPLLPIELAPYGLESLSGIDKTSAYLVDDQYHSKWSPNKENYLSIPPYTFQASFKRVGDIYLHALRTVKLSLEKVHEVNRFLFSSPPLSSPSSPSSPSSSPEEVLLAFLKHRTGPTAGPFDSPPRGNGILSVFHLLEKIEREYAHQEKKEDLNQKHIPPSE